MKPDLEIHKHIKVKAIFKRMNQTNESTKHLITVLVLVCVYVALNTMQSEF